MTLFTIGYETKNIEQFLMILKEYDVENVIDVREIANSRKMGFSKKKLNNELAKNGIEYIHLSRLGSPRELRKMLRSNTINFQEFTIRYKNHLAENNEILDNVIDVVRSKNSVLLCYEEKHELCHRSILSSIILDKIKAIEVRHL